jgi:molybdopterin molybdotransferase
LRPLAAVLAQLAEAMPVLEPRRMPAREAVGAVLAEPLAAERPVPRTAIALRSGFAVASRDLVGASGYSPVPLMQAPSRIRAGESLPVGTDAVLPEDCIVANGALYEAFDSAAPGENAVRAGEDAAEGEVLRDAGEVARAIDAVIAASIGAERLPVRRARVALVLGEDSLGRAVGAVEGAEVEIVPPSGDLSPFHVAFVISDSLVVAPDKLAAAGLALRPGEGTQVGLVGSCAVVHCPPRLDAVVAVSRCLVQPLVRHLTGQRPPVPWQRGPLMRKVSSSIGLAEVALLRTGEAGLEPLAVGALPLAALGKADAWMVIPPQSEGFAAGETVAVERLSF